MKTVQIIKTVLTAVILVWIVGGCSSKEIQQETIETESAKEVSYKALIWLQYMVQRNSTKMTENKEGELYAKRRKEKRIS